MQFHRYSSRFRSNHSVCVYEYYSIPTIISNTFDFKHTLHDAIRTRRVLFTKLVCPFFFPSSPSDWLSMKRVIAWLWKKKRERKKEERIIQACFIFHACFAIRNLCGHAFRLFSYHALLITHRFSTLYYSSVSISIYRTDCVSAEVIVVGIRTALNIDGECEPASERVRERESNSVQCLYRWYQVQYVSLINLNQIQYQRLWYNWLKFWIYLTLLK